MRVPLPPFAPFGYKGINVLHRYAEAQRKSKTSAVSVIDAGVDRGTYFNTPWIKNPDSLDLSPAEGVGGWVNRFQNGDTQDLAVMQTLVDGLGADFLNEVAEHNREQNQRFSDRQGDANNNYVSLQIQNSQTKTITIS